MLALAQTADLHICGFCYGKERGRAYSLPQIPWAWGIPIIQWWLVFGLWANGHASVGWLVRAEECMCDVLSAWDALPAKLSVWVWWALLPHDCFERTSCPSDMGKNCCGKFEVVSAQLCVYSRKLNATTGVLRNTMRNGRRGCLGIEQPPIRQVERLFWIGSEGNGMQTYCRDALVRGPVELYIFEM